MAVPDPRGAVLESAFVGGGPELATIPIIERDASGHTGDEPLERPDFGELQARSRPGRFGFGAVAWEDPEPFPRSGSTAQRNRAREAQDDFTRSIENDDGPADEKDGDAAVEIPGERDRPIWAEVGPGREG